MKNLSLSADEAEDTLGCGPCHGDDNGPKYPYGLMIHLENSEIEKLGIQDMPEAGHTLMITARVKVHSVSSSETQGGKKRRSIGLQITDMDIGPDTAKPSAEQTLYSKDGD